MRVIRAASGRRRPVTFHTPPPCLEPACDVSHFSPGAPRVPYGPTKDVPGAATGHFNVTHDLQDQPGPHGSAFRRGRPLLGRRRWPGATEPARRARARHACPIPFPAARYRCFSRCGPRQLATFRFITNFSTRKRRPRSLWRPGLFLTRAGPSCRYRSTRRRGGPLLARSVRYHRAEKDRRTRWPRRRCRISSTAGRSRA